jgi:hypothetical protein
MSHIESLIRASRSRIYKALKEANPERYRDAINAAECVILNHNLPPKAAVDVEAAVVLSVASALGVKA